MTAALEVCLDFESDPALVRLARSFVARTLRQWELDAFADDAQLLASELASNAVLHARTEIRLTLRSDGVAWVRIEVQDPQLPHADPAGLHRRRHQRAGPGHGRARRRQLGCR